MATASAPSPTPAGRLVTAETLSAAPVVVGQPLAEPWRRFAAIAADLTLVAALSIFSRPWLGIATGAMLLLLFGNSTTAPLPLKIVRTFCRGLGGALILLSTLALGHVSFLRSGKFNLEALTGRPPSLAMRENIYVPPEAGASELHHAVTRLQRQVEDLKGEIRESSRSWLHQVRTFTSALGITFGWSGVYFTLFAGGLAGRTPGKLLFRIRAAKINGHPFTFFDAFVRHGGYVAGVAMGMTGFLNLLWEPNRRAVEDRIAGTVVLKV